MWLISKNENNKDIQIKQWIVFVNRVDPKKKVFLGGRNGSFLTFFFKHVFIPVVSRTKTDIE